MTENFEKVSEAFKLVQERACGLLEDCDSKSKFSKDIWNKEIGTGITRVIQNGDKIEKGAINFSKVTGDFRPEMARTIGAQGSKFAATGVSSIFHPKNPWAPIIHMNVRYFELDTGLCWFGGGIDLTPHYIDTEQASYFHHKVKAVCDAFNPEFYADFKNQADDYFYIQHREETRGIGGIFYDHLKPDNTNNFETLLNFSIKIGELYPEIYSEFLTQNNSKPYSEKEINWQLLRRSRYVEFNLVYDRGTKFGLESKGNTESIMVSMPPDARWMYDYEPEKNSNEEKTMNLLKKGINWLDFK